MPNIHWTDPRAIEAKPYDPQAARLDYDCERLIESQGRERERGRTAPIGTLASLRAHLSANWDSYARILLTALIVYAAALTGERIKERYVPAHAYGGTND